MSLFTPFANIQTVGGGPGPSGPPVTGYDMWIDLADASTLSLSGNYITSLVTKYDNVGGSSYTFTARSGYNVYYDAANKRIDGSASTALYYLENVNTIGAALFPGGNSEDYGFRNIAHTLITITNEASFRGQPFGFQCGTGTSPRFEHFYNDATNRRDQVLDGQIYVTTATNDSTKGTVLISTTGTGSGSGAKYFYRWGSTESGGSGTAAGTWTAPFSNLDANATRLGGTARSINTFWGFTGYIYGVFHYPFALNTTERSDFVSWAVSYYGITLQ